MTKKFKNYALMAAIGILPMMPQKSSAETETKNHTEKTMDIANRDSINATNDYDTIVARLKQLREKVIRTQRTAATETFDRNVNKDREIALDSTAAVNRQYDKTVATIDSILAKINKINAKLQNTQHTK